jgi:NADPH:quinone reductase-like Zn-dependent oxidoreductase
MPVRHVWRMDKAGSLGRLLLVQDELPAPGPGEVRIAVGAVGLNFADVFACLGLYSATPSGAFIPGLEYAGLVEEVGAGVAGVEPGARVIGLTRFGAYATHLNVRASYLRPLPAGWSLADGAAYPVQALTAWYAIRDLGACKSGDAVLVHSAAGGVGLNALAILRAIGTRVVATVGSQGKIPFLMANGGLRAEQIIVRDRRRFGAQLDEALQANGLDGFDLVLDAVAGPFFQPGYERLRPAGRLVVFGAADLMPTGSRPNWLRLASRYLRRPHTDPVQMISDNKSVMGFNLIWLWHRADRLGSAFDELAAMIPRPPHIGQRFAFADARAAMRYLQSGGSVGKVVLEIEPGTRET